MEAVLFLGVLLGMRHAMESDHLAAVATLVAGRSSVRESLAHGALWGLGHTLTLLLACSAVLLLGLAMPETAARWLEAAVGAMLVLLGLDLLWRRSHGALINRDLEHSHGKHFPLRALLVGMVHGMAGSAALVLLAAQATPSALGGLAYVALFGAGSIAGMALLSMVIALPLRWSARASRLHAALQAGTGALTVGLGSSVLLTHL